LLKYQAVSLSGLAARVAVTLKHRRKMSNLPRSIPFPPLLRPRLLFIFGAILLFFLAATIVALAQSENTFFARIFFPVLFSLAAAAGWFFLWRLARALYARQHEIEGLMLDEMRYRSILATAVDAIITIDEYGIIGSVNPAAERIFGYAAAEMIGRNINMLMPEPDASRHDSYLAAYRQGGAAKIIGIGRQVTALRKNGEQFLGELAVSEVILGEQRLFTGIIRDISARVRMEQELLRQKSLFAGTFHDSPDALVVIDKNQRLLMCNPAFYDLFGWQAPAVLNQPSALLFAPDNSRRVLFHTDQTATRAPYIIHYQTRDARVFPGETLSSALHDEHGKIYAYLNVIRDISARLRGEEELRHSRANLAEAQRLAKLGSWHWDIQENRLSWSNEVYRIFGLDKSEGISYETFLAQVHRADVDKLKAAEARAHRRQSYNVEYRIRWPGGTVRWVHALAEMHFDKNGQALRLSGTMQDITARKNHEAAIQRQTASLKALNDIAASSHADVQEQLHHALQVSARHLELETAIISHIEGAHYRPLCHIGLPFAPDSQVCALPHSYCELVLRAADVVAIDSPAASVYGGHPCYPTDAPQTYIGAPFMIRGKIYGTISFSAQQCYHRHFDESDREFMRMLARWCGTVLERAHAYEELRQSEERLQRSQTFANIGTWDWNIENGDLFWSERIAPLFGYAPGKLETTYANFIQAIHPDDRDRVMSAVNACIEQGREYNLEHRVLWPDGSVHWLLEKGDVVRDATGKALKMLGVVQDITERRQYQQELARFRQVIDASNQAIGIASLEGNLIYINPAHRALLHDPDGGVLGGDWHTLIPSHAHGMIDEIRATLARGQGWHGLLPVQTQDGGEFISYSNVNLVFDECGQPSFVFNIFYDYSDELKRRQEIQDAREQAEKANRAKSEFLSSMSHELRTPLNAIIGFAQLLEKSRKEPLSARQASHVHHILKSGRHLLVLINEVLDLAKIEAGRISISLESVDIQEILEESCQLVTALALERGVTLHQPPAPPPARRVLADRTRLRQVLLNLLSNAVKYNREHGEVRVSWQSHDDFLRLAVSDTGIGISAADVPYLFEPFNRLSAENSEIEGTGVGLALSKKLMELMHGEIGYDHAPENHGATFWIRIPLASESTTAPPLPRLTHPVTPNSHVLVLYIEDNPANLALMREVLSAWTQVEFLSAPSAELGLALAKKHQPDLIILDINLPGMNGIDAIRALKSQAATDAIPVIALSADAMPHTIDKALRAGFTRYLCKPIDITELQNTLQTFISPALESTTRRTAINTVAHSPDGT
jgi:PAS domain S-box-containing protein